MRQQHVRHVLLHPQLMLCSVPIYVLALDLRCGLRWRGLGCAPSGHASFDKRSTDDRAEGTHQPLCVHQVIWEEDVFDMGYACSPVTQGVMADVHDLATR